MNQIAPIRAEAEAPGEPTPHRFTGVDVLRLQQAGVLRDRRVELIGGEIFDMPMEGDLHLDLRTRLVEWFILMLVAQSASPECRVFTNGPLRLGGTDEPEPDLYLAPRAAPMGQAEGKDVFLAIELAFTTHAHDFGRKQPLYARAGVRELWIVDGVKRETVVHRGPQADGTWREIVRHASDAPVAPLAFPELSFRLTEHLPPQAPDAPAG